MIKLNTFTKAWDKFFFEEKSTDGLALFRIIWIGMLLLYYVVDFANLNDLYGPHALISLESARREFPYFHANLFFLFNNSYEVTYAIMAVYGISLLFSFTGFFTRYSLITALVCMVSFHQRNIWVLCSSETIMRIIMLLLIVSPCGHSLSVDSLLGRKYPMFREKKTWPIWAYRLIQIQVCAIYVWTAWHKIKGDAWFDGSAVYYATRLENMKNFTLPYLMDSVPFLRALTWGTLLIEFALGLLIWVEELRKPLIYLGLLFHLGIEYIMCIPFFEINMMVLLIIFFTPDELRAFAQRNINALVRGLQESPIAVGIKEKLISTLRGQHETAN